MTTLNTSLRIVPKLYRNRRIYPGKAVIMGTTGGESSGMGSYIAGNGIAISGSEISLDTNFIEVTPVQGMKLKYNNIIELEVISGGIDIKNILKVGTVQERVTDAGILFGSVLKVDQLNARVGINNSMPEYDLDVTGHCRITGSPLFGNHVLSIYDGTRDIGASGGSYFRHGYFLGSIYSDNIKLNWQDIEQILDADNTGLFTSSVFRFGDDMYSKDTTFASGFTGAGWKLDKTGLGETAKYGLELDSLRVRGSMNVYELILNHIRATNGSLWVSDAAKIESSTTGETYDYEITFDIDNNNLPVPFVVNDLLRCQQFDGRDIKYYVARVMEVIANDELAINIVDGGGVPAANDALVRMGNTSVSTRQGAIYLTASDSNNPYIEVLSGVNSGTAALGSFRKARLGNLTGITDPEFGALSGYGLWSENIYLTGSIKATAGKIAAWTITGTRMSGASGDDAIHIDAVGNGTSLGLGMYMRRPNATDRIVTVGFGQIHNKDTYNVLSADYGLEIIKYNDSSYKHILRIGGTQALIACWNIDNDAIYTGTKKVTNGYSTDGITLDAAGAMHTPNFYINSNGDVGFRGKEIIYAYIGTSDDIILSHNTIEARVNQTYIKVKTITLGQYIQGSKTLRIKFDLRVSDDTYLAYGRVYKNGTPVGGEQLNGTETWVTKTQNIAGWSANDDIELWIKISGGTTQTAQIQNFRVCGEQAVQVNEITGENTYP